MIIPDVLDKWINHYNMTFLPSMSLGALQNKEHTRPNCMRCFGWFRRNLRMPFPMACRALPGCSCTTVQPLCLCVSLFSPAICHSVIDRLLLVIWFFQIILNLFIPYRLLRSQCYQVLLILLTILLSLKYILMFIWGWNISKTKRTVVVYMI